MNLEVFRHLATNLVTNHPEMEMRVEMDQALYKGKGNPCQILAIVFDGLRLNREQRLNLIGYIYNMPAPSSMKKITAAQLHALRMLRDSLGDAWTTYSLTSSTSK